MAKRLPMRTFKEKYPRRFTEEGDSWLVLDVHRVVSSPADADFPEMSSELHDAIAYWEGACYLMTAILGWSNPGKGLLWWYEQDKDTIDDPRLAILKELWDDHQQLELLASWFWSPNSLPFWNFFAPLTKDADPALCPPMLYTRDHQFWNDFYRKYPNEKPGAPYPEGNGLHLVHFGALWGEPQTHSSLKKVSRADRRATLVIPEWPGWYAVLRKECRHLGVLGWTIDVVVAGIGWLGSYRRSPVTGLWYQGKHYVHLAGNLHPQGEQEVHQWSNADYFSDELYLLPEVVSFYKKEKLQAALMDDSPNFHFTMGEQRRSGKGKLRTVVGYGYRQTQTGESVYIMRMDDEGGLCTKRTERAHEEYGPVVNIDSAVLSFANATQAMNATGLKTLAKFGVELVDGG